MVNELQEAIKENEELKKENAMLRLRLAEKTHITKSAFSILKLAKKIMQQIIDNNTVRIQSDRNGNIGIAYISNGCRKDIEYYETFYSDYIKKGIERKIDSLPEWEKDSVKYLKTVNR